MSPMPALSLLVAVATAAPLEVEVVRPDPGPPAYREPAPRRWAPLGRGEVVVDGDPADEAWEASDPVPPLRPFTTGHRPPEVDLRALVTDEGLALRLLGVPADHRVELLVDPEGLGARWWRLDVGPDATRLEACGFEPLEMPFEATLHPVAAPCGEAEGEVRSGWGDDAVEVLLPWATLGPSTTDLRLLALVRGPDGHGGTLAASGAETLALHEALPVATDGPRPRLRIRRDLLARRWEVRVDRDGIEAPWTCSRRQRGAILRTFEVPEEGTLVVPLTEHPDSVLDCRAEVEGPLVPAARGMLEDPGAASLVTPVFRDRLEVAFRMPVAVEGVPVVLRGPKGVIAEGTVDLPRGVGAVRIPADPDWRTVFVTVGPWVVYETAVREGRR